MTLTADIKYKSNGQQGALKGTPKPYTYYQKATEASLKNSQTAQQVDLCSQDSSRGTENIWAKGKS